MDLTHVLYIMGANGTALCSQARLPSTCQALYLYAVQGAGEIAIATCDSNNTAEDYKGINAPCRQLKPHIIR